MIKNIKFTTEKMHLAQLLFSVYLYGVINWLV